jgi:hypothetical protein
MSASVTPSSAERMTRPAAAGAATTAITPAGIGNGTSTLAVAAAPELTKEQEFNRDTRNFLLRLREQRLIFSNTYQPKEIKNLSDNPSAQRKDVAADIAAHISQHLPDALKNQPQENWHLTKLKLVGDKLVGGNLIRLWVRTCCALIKCDISADKQDGELAEFAKALITNEKFRDLTTLIDVVANYASNPVIVRGRAVQTYTLYAKYDAAYALIEKIADADLKKLDPKHRSQLIDFAALGLGLFNQSLKGVTSLDRLYQQQALVCLKRAEPCNENKSILAVQLLMNAFDRVPVDFDFAKAILQACPQLKSDQSLEHFVHKTESAPPNMLVEREACWYSAIVRVAEDLGYAAEIAPYHSGFWTTTLGYFDEQMRKLFTTICESRKAEPIERVRKDVEDAIHRSAVQYKSAAPLLTAFWSVIIGNLDETSQVAILEDLLLNQWVGDWASLSSHLPSYARSVKASVLVKVAANCVSKKATQQAYTLMNLWRDEELADAEKQSIKFGLVADKLSERGDHSNAIELLKRAPLEEDRNRYGQRIIVRLIAEKKYDQAATVLAICTDADPVIKAQRVSVACLNPKKETQTQAAPSPPSAFQRGKAEVKRLWNSSFAFKLFSFLTAGLLPLFTLLINAIKRPGGK